MAESSLVYSSPGQLEQLAGAAQQVSTPTVDAIAQRPPNPRKRRVDGSAVSSRNVANLTPEQLSKKRANDREAQRAIRERTKNTIESLEKKVKELESSQPYQELASIIRARDAALQENEELKRRLASITTLAHVQQAAIQGHGLNDLAIATAQQDPLPLPSQVRGDGDFLTGRTDDETRAILVAANNENLHPDLRTTQPASTPVAIIQSGQDTTESLSPKQKRPRKRADLQEYQRLPIHSHGTTDADRAVLQTVSKGRDALRRGQASDAVLGPSEAPFFLLVFGSITKQQHPLATAMDFLSPNRDLLGTHRANAVAIMYMLNLYVRWLIHPTKDEFETLPSWLRPTAKQLDQEHAFWVDLLPWPAVRNTAITSPESWPYETFSSDFLSNLSLNFPYDPNLCLIRTEDSDGDEDWIINPIFEEHIRDIKNWTVDAVLDRSE